MNRLTKIKNHYGDYTINEEAFSLGEDEYQCCINALGYYEDIEEELGVDLITLFKALKNGIWSKGGFYEDQIADKPTFIANPEIKLCSYYSESDENYNIIVNEEKVWCIYTYDYEVMVRQTRLKDYGKTWALTKKELKDE